MRVSRVVVGVVRVGVAVVGVVVIMPVVGVATVGVPNVVVVLVVPIVREPVVAVVVCVGAFPERRTCTRKHDGHDGSGTQSSQAEDSAVLHWCGPFVGQKILHTISSPASHTHSSIS